MNEWLADFKETIATAAPRLLRISEAQSEQPRAEEHWSAKQIIGHLIDSATNNHARFVVGQLKDDLIFPGYDQDAWVAVQAYRDAPWNELIELCMLFNSQIARLMDAIPERERRKARAHHNLDVLAWKAVPRDEPTTLDYFMADYVGHFKHHLNQVVRLD